LFVVCLAEEDAVVWVECAFEVGRDFSDVVHFEAAGAVAVSGVLAFVAVACAYSVADVAPSARVDYALVDFGSLPLVVADALGL
jgi:hypothetical protein